MAFDPSTARPASRGFNPATARPLNTASPEDSKVTPRGGRVDYEGGTGSRMLDTAREALYGLTMEFGDEAGAAMATAFAKMGGDDNDWGAIYDDVKGTIDYQREQFQEDSPILSTGANLAGAILAPIKGPAAGSAVGRRVAQAAAESGVTGIGAADGDIGDRLEQGAYDAVQGAAFQGALSKAGRAARNFGERKIEAPLLKDGTFTPITEFVDADSKLGKLYNVVKKTIPGRAMIRDQYKPMLKKATEAVREAGGTVSEALPRTNKNVKDAAIRKAGTKLREDFIEDSIPNALVRQNEELATRIRKGEPEQAMEDLEKWWNTDGFGDAKKIAYQIDDDGMDALAKKITSAVDDPALRGRAGETEVRDMLEGIYREPGADDVVGAFAGKDLFQLRNDFAMGANRFKGDGAQGLNRAANRKVANELDSFIRGQIKELDPSLVDEFDDQLGRYATFSIAKDAQSKANKAFHPDVFKPSQVMAASPSRQVRSGGSSLYDETKGAQKEITDRVSLFEKAQRAESDLAERAPTAGQAAMGSVFETAHLGRIPSFLGRAASLGTAGVQPFLSGMARSAGLASQRGQRFKAGQLPSQMKAQEIYAALLRKGIPESEALDMAKRALVRQSVAGD